jgi:uncharacterized membrane protein
MVGSFPYYLRGGQIALMMGSILNGMKFINIFMKNKIFVYAYLGMTIAGGLFVIIRLTCCTQGKS